MPETSINNPAVLRTKAVFLRDLGSAVERIEHLWQALRASAWESDKLDEVFSHIQKLAEGGHKHELSEVNESLFSLEAYLSSFVNSEQEPSAVQLDKMDELIGQLSESAAAAIANSPESNSEAAAPATLVLCAGSDKPALDTALALEAKGATVERMDDIDDVLEALETTHPSLIVADTSIMPSIGPLAGERMRLQAEQNLHIPLVFVGRSNALQLRVEAIRAGSDAFFVAPFDSREIARKIMQLLTPMVEEHYRIMVVEDDPSQAEFAASILTKAGMEVQAITEPMRVLEALEAFNPDLILMDIYMPDVNGIELTTIIREQKEFVAIPIVFLSGEQSAEKQLDALSFGGDDFIPKPIRPKHLLTVVKNRVRRTRKMLAAYSNAALSTPSHEESKLLSRQQVLDLITKNLEEGGDPNRPAGIVYVRPDGLDELSRQLDPHSLEALLAELAQVVTDGLEDGDAACRFDDQGIVAFIQRADNGRLLAMADTLSQRIAEHSFVPDGDAVKSTVSTGLCLFDEHFADAAGLVARAERASARAATDGGNRVHVFSVEDESAADPGAETDLGELLRLSLAHNDFVIRYQPLLDLQTRGSENYEVILRMPTPDGESVGERDLREPAAERGLTEALDQWLLERTVAALKERRQAGRLTHLFVHQSGLSALDPDHPTRLQEKLRAQQIVGTGLVLDFRLSDLTADLKAAKRNFDALKKMDVKISISRFPEKPAAFKALRFLGVHYLRIAPRLLKAERDVITSVLHDAHNLGVRVIVANVDTARSIDLHWSSGADFLQGAFIQAPMDDMDYDFSQVVI